jgi:hypothetical protein
MLAKYTQTKRIKEVKKMKIKLIFDEKEEVLAEIFDTDCAKAIYSILPIEANLNTWGDEFYFSIPLEYPLDIGYWPPGKAIAIFFGPTPASVDENPVPASEVNIIGRLLDDPAKLKEFKKFKKIKIVSFKN